MSNTPAEQALELVRRLEESGALGTGGRLPALLRYLVQEELAGRGDRLKAYSIATEVLGRGQNFDPSQDSIVRVEIGRLRKALDLFYATQGKDEAVRIDIPRGASRPRISFDPETDAPPEPAKPPPPSAPADKRWLYAAAALAVVLALAAFLFVPPHRPAEKAPAYAAATPKLIILPVRTEGGDADLRTLALGLRAQLAAELSRQKWLTVLLLDSAEGYASEPKLFVADPVLTRDSGSFVLSAQLASESDRNLRWSARYRDARLHEPMSELASALAAELARDLGYPLGPIGQAVAAKSSATDAEVEDQFLCMMNAYRYWRDRAPQQAADARACLTRLVAAEPDFAQGRAALALLTIEDAKNEDGDKREAGFARAAALLRGAPDDDRLSIHARMSLAACQGDADKTRTLAHALASAAPNDPESLAEAAHAAGLGALDWPFALETESRALKLVRKPRPIYSQAAAAKAVTEQNYEAALTAISRAPQQGDALGQAMLYVVARLADAPARAEGAEAALAKLDMNEPEALKKAVARACWNPQVRQAFTEAIARAPDKATR